MNIKKNTSVTDDVVSHITHAVNSHVIADVARDDGATGNTARHLQIVILKHDSFDGSDTHHTVKTIVFHQIGVEIISDKNGIPTSGSVVVLHKTLDLVGTQMTPAVFRLLDLLISEKVFIVTVFKIFLIDEVLVNTFVW